MRNYSDTFDIYNDTKSYLRWTKNSFGLRLAMLREERGLSARRMSLDLGQNKNYINSIESGKNFPTMDGFLNICDYLRIEPQCFFHPYPERSRCYSYFEEVLCLLSDSQIKLLYQLACSLATTTDPHKQA